MNRRNVSRATGPTPASLLTLAAAGLASLVWLGLVHRYVADGPGWGQVMASHPTDFAVFLASIGAPLAAVWLIAAFVLLALGQRRLQEAVLQAQWQAGRTAGDIEALVRTSIEMQEQARRQSFLNGADLALKDLNSQAGMLIGRLGVLGAEDTEYLWALHAAGDPWAFCHAILERSVAERFVDDLADRVINDEVALGGLYRFLRRYDRLSALAKEYDADKLVREVLEDSPLDRVHALFQAVAAVVHQRLGPPPAAITPGTEGSALETAPPPDDWTAVAEPGSGWNDVLEERDGPPQSRGWTGEPDMPDRPPPGYGEGPIGPGVDGRGHEPRDGFADRVVRGLEAVLGPAGPIGRLTDDMRLRLADWRHGRGARRSPGGWSPKDDEYPAMDPESPSRPWPQAGADAPRGPGLTAGDVAVDDRPPDPRGPEYPARGAGLDGGRREPEM
ncbi:hypothetical protein [Roseospira visakhapatnamensis]|uniref:Uncharacterized protein n=1 Tax=Roseospira visakhapatnamensis TaxID=390880 RepID=A0A7W6W9L6_9PROT|nr:hypothetical protein [Roseospira visakhapatnamensis]MBB4265999.1 hypothetical protein [Roseospira visakhapatnamensis]